jgi:hypothetical protein
MASAKFDALIEAVRYAADGQIELARIYERRGAAFSDCVLISRAELIARLKQGKKFMTGERRELWGGTFNTGKSVQLAARGDQPVIATSASAERDLLEGVPVF